MITLWWTRSSGWVTWCIVDKNAILNKVMGLKGGENQHIEPSDNMEYWHSCYPGLVNKDAYSLCWTEVTATKTR